MGTAGHWSDDPVSMLTCNWVQVLAGTLSLESVPTSSGLLVARPAKSPGDILAEDIEWSTVGHQGCPSTTCKRNQGLEGAPSAGSDPSIPLAPTTRRCSGTLNTTVLAVPLLVCAGRPMARTPAPTSGTGGPAKVYCFIVVCHTRLRRQSENR